MTLEAAICLAASAHAGQPDKAGEPYILHPLRVMGAVSPRARVVAVLHDVVEDTELNWPDLDWRLSADELAALRAVTRAPEGHPGRVTYREFVQAIADMGGEAGEIAREVKLADIRDNLSPARAVPELAGMRRRYALALRTLGRDPEREEWYPR